MKKIALMLAAIVGFSAPLPAIAASCMDLWIARNTIFDNNGYCFGTNLGKSYFDNSDCHTKNARLSKRERRQVSRIKRMERAQRCRINTRATASSGGSAPAARRPAQRRVQRRPSAPTTYAYKCHVNCVGSYMVNGKSNRREFKINFQNVRGTSSSDAFRKIDQWAVCKKGGGRGAITGGGYCMKSGW